MEQHLEFRKTYRYETNDCVHPKRVLYVLHGYGQLVKFFIRKFHHLPSDTLIIAPEGMHRFYLSGSSGRVGASWMTKEAREDDINDNIQWLNALHKEITNRFGVLDTHLIGFSQGGATAARWQQLGNVSFKSMALWACVFPPDLNMQVTGEVRIPSFFIIGSEDEFYDAPSQEKLIKFYTSNDYKIVQYEGKHDIDNETLLKLFRQMIM